MARDFNGTTDRIDYASAFTTSGADLTFAAWINLDITQPVTTIDYIFNSSDTTNGFATVFAQHFGATYAFQHARFTNATAKQRVTNSLAGTIATGTWFSLVVTDLGNLTGTDVHIYINGTEATYSSTVSGTGTENVGDQGFILGGRTADDLRNFNGKLANVGVWNRVLDAAEIASLADGLAPRRIPNGLKFAPHLINEIGDPYTGSGTADGTTAVEHPRTMGLYRKLGGIFKIAVGGGTTTPLTLAATVSFTAAATKQVGKNVVATATFTPAFVKSVGMGLAATTIAIAGTTMSVGKTLAATLPFTAGITVSRAFLVTLAATVSFSAALVKSVGKVLGAAVTFTPAITETPSVAPVVTPPSAFTGFAGLGWVHGATSRWGRRKPSWQRRK